VRNACAAISLLSTSLQARQQLAQDEDYVRLMALIEGLEKIASFQLRYQSPQTPETVPLQEVLDTLRIIVEADWREIGGVIRWPLTAALPRVFADPHGLLQAFLNLLQNSRRAVQASPRRELRISASVSGEKITLRLEDTGPGVVSPELLFQPFHAGADGSGLGLYISRSLVRSYGGDLRFVKGTGSCFEIELQVAG
jgi:C4-dicarboxylate-specific signal transduction histidine kinase